MYRNFCYLCNTEKLTRPCPTCGKPTCKDCMKTFPFSNSVCLECASGVKTRLAGIKNDEEIFWSLFLESFSGILIPSSIVEMSLMIRGKNNNTVWVNPALYCLLELAITMLPGRKQINHRLIFGIYYIRNAHDRTPDSQYLRKIIISFQSSGHIKF